MQFCKIQKAKSKWCKFFNYDDMLSQMSRYCLIFKITDSTFWDVADIFKEAYKLDSFFSLLDRMSMAEVTNLPNDKENLWLVPAFHGITKCLLTYPSLFVNGLERWMLVAYSICHVTGLHQTFILVKSLHTWIDLLSSFLTGSCRLSNVKTFLIVKLKYMVVRKKNKIFWKP